MGDVVLMRYPALFFARSRQDKIEAMREVYDLLGSGAKSLRELSRASSYWRSQVGFALARLLYAGLIRKVDEGRYERAARW